MLRSLFSGISGLRTHQTMMDVTGNNIANVNTAGFKGSQATFQDTLSQLVTAAGAPQGGVGGTNPAQVGLGSRLAGITTNFGQGAVQNTGRSTDLMIQGDGFFAVNDGNETLFTRNGSFSFDANGTLVTSGGKKVMGWQANNAGVVNSNAAAGPIRLPIGIQLAPTPTTTASFGGNLPGDAAFDPVAVPPVIPTITTSITVYDAMGTPTDLAVTFTRATPTAPNVVAWDVSFDGGATTASTFEFDAAGALAAPASPILTNGGIDVDLSKITSFSGDSTVNPVSQDGSEMGSLQAFTISPDGTLVGVFSNGLKQPLGQVAMVTFNNPPGLEKAGDSTYRNTVNSGPAQFGTAGAGGRGVLQAGALEMSNVDLAQEFTNLVIAQRGFQANSRVITTSDELLQDLVNLKR
jgi:flagellar hook protein FlgE